MVEYHDEDLGRVHRFAYDCFGRRIMKIIDHNCQGFSKIERRFVLGGPADAAAWQILEEYRRLPLCPPALCGGEGQPACPAFELAATYVYGNYIDEPLSMRRDLDLFGPASPQDYFYHQDDLFNVVALTNAAGSVVERITYGDYGFPTINDANGSFAASESTVGNPYLFTGREWDAEFRFYQYRTRSMDPTLGRFTTRDSIGTWGDWAHWGNGVAFVASTPTNALDPLGLDTWIENTKRVCGTHRRVCVDVWNDDCTQKVGQHCISFGGTGVSEACSSTSCESAYNIDPRNDGNGMIYHDTDDDATSIHKTKSQGCHADKEMLKHMKESEGRRLGYCPGLRDCRIFSEEFMNDPANDKWKVRPLTSKEQSERDAISRRRQQWDESRHQRPHPWKW